MKPKTYVSIILDKSGSMESTKAQTIQGYNEQVQQMKLNSKEQDIFCSLITFSGDVFEHLWSEPAEKLTEITDADYAPEGSTAMRDAIGYTVKKLMETTDTKDPNVAYLVVIISDGEENSSKHYSVGSLKELIESMQKTGKWTFTYMGCSGDYLKKVAEQTSIPIANMAVFSNATPAKAKFAYKRSNAKLSDYYGIRAKGAVACANVFSTDSNNFADFSQEIDNIQSLVTESNPIEQVPNDVQ